MVGEDSCWGSSGAAGRLDDEGTELRSESRSLRCAQGDMWLLSRCPPAPPYSVAVVSSNTGFTGGMIGSSGYPITASTMR